MMTGGPLFIVVGVALQALLAGTLRSVKQNLIHRPADQTRPITIVVFDLLESLLWAGCLFGLIAAAPHPVTLVLAALFVVSIATARELRYREEKRSLNRWLRMAADTNVSLSHLLDSVANGCRSRLARQAKKCVNRLNRGESIADAARRSKLPLDADTIAAIMVPTPGQRSWRDSLSLIRVIDSDAQIRRDHESSESTSLSFQQFTYVVATMFLAWLVRL